MKEGGSIFWKHIFLLGGEKYEFLHFPAKSICLFWEAYGIYSGLSNVGFWIKLAQSKENTSFKPSRDVLPCIVWQQHKNSPTKRNNPILCFYEWFGCVAELWCVALWMIEFVAFMKYNCDYLWNVLGYWCVLFSVLWYWGKAFVVLFCVCCVLLWYIVCCRTMQRRVCVEGCCHASGGITSTPYICKFLWPKCKLICQICFSLKSPDQYYLINKMQYANMKSWLNQNAQINILYLLNPKFHHMAKKDQFVPL